MTSSKKYFYEINIAKGIGMLLVIIGHAFPDAEKEFYLVGGKESFAFFIENLIYSFHMPLFMLCSGFLFLPKLTKGINTRAEISKRFQRLMIPYFFYSIVVYILKIFFNQYANHPIQIQDIWKVFICESPSGGVWFLWTLFVITLFCIITRRIGVIYISIISILIYIAPYPEQWMEFKAIQYLSHYLLWFIAGGLLAKYYEVIKYFLQNKYVYISSFILLIIFQFLSTNNEVLNISFDTITTLSGIIASLGLSYLIVSFSKENKLYQIFDTIGKYSMEIFLLSYYIQVPLRVLYINFGVLNYIPYSIFVIISTIAGIIIPIIIAQKWIYRSKILSKLLLGK